MFRRFTPLRVRLPMTVALLLAVCTGAVITTAYRVVRRSVTDAAAIRLRGAGGQIVALLEPSVRRAQTDAQRVAAVPALAAWLRSGSSSDASARLDSVRKAAPQTAAIVLVRPNGEHIFSGDSSLASSALTAPTGVGQFFKRGNAAGYSFAAPLLSGRDTIGRLITERVMNPRASNAEVLANLIGKDASFRIGNVDGSLWTDFERPAPPPIDAARARESIKSAKPILGDTISAVLPIAGTPWMLWVGQPAATAEQPATTLVRQLTLIALIGIVLAAAIAWWTILRITAPLGELAVASDALARGDYERRIPHATATDEVGRASIAFNSMAETIGAHHHRLEEMVADRTAALERALADLRTAQDENVRKERLAVLGQLAGGVGHELRNPLGVMTNAVYVLETIIPNPDPMVRDYFGILKGQISLSEKIVSDLLDFARTKPPNRSVVGIDSIARAQVERLGPNTIPIEWDMPEALPMVFVDSVQIGQVVFNLVTNATQVMHGREGSIRMRAFHDGNGTAILEVHDSGPGIPEDVAKRIFEPLFTTKAKGLGLGLSVSRMLAENNGGRLWFETTVGAGTTFSLSLPVAPHE
jgi:signal transduction histidine kinase